MKYTKAEIEKAVEDLEQECATDIAQLITLMNDNGYELTEGEENNLFLEFALVFDKLMSRVTKKESK